MDYGNYYEMRFRYNSIHQSDVLRLLNIAQRVRFTRSTSCSTVCVYAKGYEVLFERIKSIAQRRKHVRRGNCAIV